MVTGLGVVTGLGLGWADFWRSLLAGASAIRRWQLRGAEDLPVKFAAPADLAAVEASLAAHGIVRPPPERRTAFGLEAARQALEDGRWSADHARMGVAIGSGVPERDPRDLLLAIGPEGATWQRWIERRGELSPGSGLRCTSDSLAARVARQFGLHGPVLNFNTACAGAAHAIGFGFRAIRRGEVECMLVGGADSVLNLPTMVGLHLLGAPSVTESFGERLCRPFDRDRSGLVAGEGAGMVLLESERHARARGALIHAELCGFGSSLDAHRITAPHPEGKGAALAMSRAIADGGLTPEQIDCINAHGTSTPLNDPAETRAIKAVFAERELHRRIAVTANKSMFGHLVAAAGAPELIATVLSVRDAVVPPTLNLEHQAPDCDLERVPRVMQALPIRAALSNSFGFGGLNASLLVKHYEY